jgi:hypothetical protein
LLFFKLGRNSKFPFRWLGVLVGKGSNSLVEVDSIRLSSSMSNDFNKVVPDSSCTTGPFEVSAFHQTSLGRLLPNNNTERFTNSLNQVIPSIAVSFDLEVDC